MAVLDSDLLSPPAPATPSSSWADEHRATLLRAIADLRAIQSPAAVPIPAPRAVPPPGAGAGSPTVAPMVETMLRAAMVRLEAEAAAASRETDRVVADAMARAAAVQVETDHLVATAIARATELRRATPLLASVAPSARPPRPLAAAPTWDDGDDVAFDALGPDHADDRNPAQVYERFWADASGDRPVIERLRRWAQREAL